MSKQEPAKLKPLTPRQERFCASYAVEGNGQNAAIKAGYAPKYARQQGYKILKNGRVAARIEELRAELSDRHSVTADSIIERYRKMALGDPVNLVVRDEITGKARFKAPEELTEDERGMISDVSIRTYTVTDPLTGEKLERQQFSYKLVNIKDALDSLSRTFGMFRDKVEHEHTHKITELFQFVADHPENSETVTMLDRKYRRGPVINGESQEITK